MDDGVRFRHRVRVVIAAWAALLALLLASAGSAFVPLGAWNAAIGLGIAALKSAIVLVVFMHLGRASAMARIAAAAGLFTLALLVGLGGLDYATRVVEPAAMQQPQQLRALGS